MDINLTLAEQQLLIEDIASRQYTTGTLARNYGIPVDTLRQFFALNKEAVIKAKQRQDQALTANELPEDEDTPPAESFAAPPPYEVTAQAIQDLWIAQKAERLTRAQLIAEKMFNAIMSGAFGPTELRELRFYMNYAASELGQLMLKGSGDTGEQNSLNLSIDGVNMETLRLQTTP